MEESSNNTYPTIALLKQYFPPSENNALFTHEIQIFPVKLVTVVKGDPKAPFSIVTTPRCRGGRYSFPWIAPFHPWYVPYIAEC